MGEKYLESKGADQIMNFTEIRELYKNREAYLDQKVTVGGWIRSIRDSKTFGFIVVNDGTFFEPLQVVYHDKMDNFAEVSKLNVGTAVIVTGTLVLRLRQNSHLRYRRTAWRWREHHLRIIRCRKSATALNFSARSLICGPEPIPSRQCSASGL